MKLNIHTIKDNLFEIKILQRLFYIYYLILAFIYYLNKNYYLCLKACCRVKRIIPNLSRHSIINRIYNKIFSNFILKDNKLVSIAENVVYQQFLNSKECMAIRKLFLQFDMRHIVSLKYPKENDYSERQGNLLILKKYDPHINEKGVLYLKYNESFKQFCALFDLVKISRHYRIVLEPSTWGYMDESFHIFIGKELDVIVQAQDEEDYKIIKNMNTNLVPIRLGAGDWVDIDIFNDGVKYEKTYDIIMVASWLKIKRHNVLFKAIAKSKLNDIKVALVGYPWGGRTRSDIEKEARRFNVLNQIDFYENIPSQKVSEIIKKAKVAVMLTKREGANRGIYECLLNGVPVILYRYNRGVNKDVINAETGCFADDDELGNVLKTMLNNYERYNPAQWAKKNIGCENAHIQLNNLLMYLATNKGESYQTDICRIKASNAPYINSKDRVSMENEYLKLTDYLRQIDFTSTAQ